MSAFATPMVSVLITVYNREKYIAAAIESVLAQSYENFELIIVDDGSSDGSVEIIRSYTHDSRIKFNPNSRNIGQFKTRNRAAALANGKYLKYVDSDDVIYPHCLEVMVHLMERFFQAGMMLCAWHGSDPFYPIELTPNDFYRRQFIKKIPLSNSPLTSIFKKDVFLEAGGYDTEHWPLSADWELLLKIGRMATVVLGPTGLGYYRIHEGQVESSHANLVSNFHSESIGIALSALRHPLCPLDQAEKLALTRNFSRLGLLYSLALLLKHGAPFAALRFMKRHKINLLQLPRALPCEFVTQDVPSRHLVPDWQNYPRAVPMGTLTTTPDIVKISVVFSALYDSDSLRTGIESILVQSLSETEVLLPENLRSDHSLPWLSDPRIRFFPVSDASSVWSILNAGAAIAHGVFLKFMGPETLLYPYSLEFEYVALTVDSSKSLLVSGNAGFAAIQPMVFSPKEAVSVEASGNGYLLRADTSCCLVRREMFIAHGGFVNRWREWSAVVLFAEITVHNGLVHGLPAQSSRWNIVDNDMKGGLPIEIAAEIERICLKQWGPSPGQAWLPTLSAQRDDYARLFEDATTMCTKYYAWSNDIYRAM